MFNKSVSDYFDFEIIIGLLLTLVMACFGIMSSKVFLCEYDEADVWEYLMDHLHHSGLVCESSLLE